MITDDYVHLIAHYKLWDRGDGIAEVVDIEKNDNGAIFGTIIHYVHGEQYLDFDEEGEICGMVSAFPGIIHSGVLSGLRVENEQQLANLLIATWGVC